MSARPAGAAAAAADWFLEMECAQICKHGQVACGDAFGIERIDAESRALAVLSDGLGSGVKASVLSNMTMTMAMRFLRSDMDVLQSVETIQDALPVDSVRQIAYATFSMLDVQVGGRTRLAEMGNPRYVQLRGLEDVAPAAHRQIVSPRWPDRPIETYELDLRLGSNAQDTALLAGIQHMTTQVLTMVLTKPSSLQLTYKQMVYLSTLYGSNQLALFKTGTGVAL